MSRVGRKPIVLPSEVKVSISDTELEVQGPKGKLTTLVPPGIRVAQEDKQVVVRPLKAKKGGDEKKWLALLTKQEKSNWGWRGRWWPTPLPG